MVVDDEVWLHFIDDFGEIVVGGFHRIEALSKDRRGGQKRLQEIRGPKGAELLDDVHEKILMALVFFLFRQHIDVTFGIWNDFRQFAGELTVHRIMHLRSITVELEELLGDRNAVVDVACTEATD